MFDALGLIFAAAGVALFVAGTAGLLRFPDLYTRLHALTKADTLGLGLVCVGAALHWGDPLIALKLGLIWLLVMASSTVLAHLIARAARRDGVRPWEAE